MKTDFENQIRDLLIAKGNYEEADETLISELMFHLEMLESCRDSIRSEGIKTNVTVRKGAKPYWVRNLSFTGYLQVFKSLNSIFTALGLSPKERAMLKNQVKDELDTFDLDLR